MADDSNFSLPDDTPPGQGGQYRPTGTGDNGETWDPVQKRWVPQSQMAAVSGGGGLAGGAPRATFAPGSWGGTGDSLDANGHAILGTNGMEQDVARYRAMAQGGPASGPQIDTTRSDQDRLASLGSLGLLAQTASGSTPSAAERLGAAQTQNAENAQYGLAASVRGGAGARAAASRGAVAGAATIGAIGAQQARATRAGEMAGARDAYFNAATGQRGQDLGLATSQAQLDAQQRAANLQQEGFFEGLGQDTKNAQLSHDLGRTASEDAAANASRSAGLAEDAASRGVTKDIASTGVGGATGAVKGYSAWQSGQTGGSDGTKPQQSADPWDPSNYSGSDKRMKTGVRPISDAEAKRLSSEADTVTGKVRSYMSSLDAGPAIRRVGDGTPENGYTTELTDGAEKSFGAQRKALYGNDTGDDYDLRGAYVAGESRAGNGHMTDRFKKPNHETFSDESQYAGYRPDIAGHWVGEKYTPKGTREPAPYEGKYVPSVAYASVPDVVSGADHAAPQQSLDDAIAARVAQDNAGADLSVREDPYHFDHAPKGYAASREGQAGYMFGPAPEATHGFEAPVIHAGARGERDREVMLSDSRAKAAAWDEGRQAALAQVEAASQMSPEELRKHSEGTPEVAAVKKLRAGSWDEGRRATKEGAAQEAREYMRDHGMQEAPAAGSPVERPASWGPAPAAVAPPAPAPAPEQPGYFAGFANRARAMVSGMPSDERTKRDVHGESAMASANRSMAPFEYEYRPGYAEEAGQRDGEKNVGPMAQNMAANPLASTAIVKRPDGMLAIDKDKGLKLVMGGLAGLQEQVDDMKKRKTVR